MFGLLTKFFPVPSLPTILAILLTAFGSYEVTSHLNPNNATSDMAYEKGYSKGYEAGVNETKQSLEKQISELQKENYALNESYIYYKNNKQIEKIEKTKVVKEYIRVGKESFDASIDPHWIKTYNASLAGE